MKIRAALKFFGNLAFRVLFILIIIVLGLHFNRLFDALLLIVIILQFELAYMQYWNEKARYNPIFRAELNTSQGASYMVKLYNLSSEPAYSVSVCRVLCKGKPIDPNEWENSIKDKITPCLFNSEESVHVIEIDRIFYDTELIPNLCILEICYETKSGDLGTLYLYFSGYIPMVRMPQYERPIGFLMAIPKYIAMLTVSWRLKMLEKKLQKKSSPKLDH
jgi:hypothetical protein